MKKSLIVWGIVLLAVALAVCLTSGADRLVSRVMQAQNPNVMVIDAGHGGMDGGAVSSQGISEKAINLEIAMELKKLAEEAGWIVVMTREADICLGEDQPTIRSKKVRDLHARQEIIEKTLPALAISIHLNSFKQDSSVHGIQVFYPERGGDEKDLQRSEKLAKVIQKNVTAGMEDQKKRTALAKTDVFLFKEIVCPIVIVECGFLSNSNEAGKLQKASYQQKLTKNIFYGVSEFSEKKCKKNYEVIENTGNSSVEIKYKRAVDNLTHKKNLDREKVEILGF